MAETFTFWKLKHAHLHIWRRNFPTSTFCNHPSLTLVALDTAPGAERQDINTRGKGRVTESVFAPRTQAMLTAALKTLYCPAVRSIDDHRADGVDRASTPVSTTVCFSMV